MEYNGADDRSRTGDLVITSDPLCQLSYVGLHDSNCDGSCVSTE